MTAKHTPGPWIAKEYTCHAATTIIAADGTPVAETSGFGRMSNDCVADARLIAAAPELLAALEILLESGTLNAGSRAIARSAISKATGAC